MIELDKLTEEEKALLRMAFRLLTEAVKHDEYRERDNDVFNLKMKLGIWEFVD